MSNPLAMIKSWLDVFNITVKIYNYSSNQFETAMSNTLNAIGDAHFNAASRAIRESEAERNQQRKYDLLTMAESGCRSAFEFYSGAVREYESDPVDFITPKARKISAHFNACQAALGVSAINSLSIFAGYTTAEQWIRDARSNFWSYENLADRAARNGARIRGVQDVVERYGSRPHGAEGTVPVGGWQGLQKRDEHMQRLRDLIKERQLFDEICKTPQLAAVSHRPH